MTLVRCESGVSGAFFPRGSKVEGAQLPGGLTLDILVRLLT
jgi:hypothetical protein